MAPSPPVACTFANQVSGGEWAPDQAFVPHTCRLRRPLEAKPLRRCLANRTISFVGDSVMRELGLAMASLLESFGTQAQRGATEWEQRWRVDATTGRPTNTAIGASLNRTLRRTLCASSPVRNTAGSRGTWRHPFFGVTLRIFNDASRAVHWGGEHGIRRIVSDARARAIRGEPGAGSSEVMFVSLGVHDTNTAISERVGAQQAMRWRSDPLSWTHGPVFRPFLDHWCEAAKAVNHTYTPQRTLPSAAGAARADVGGGGSGAAGPSRDPSASTSSDAQPSRHAHRLHEPAAPALVWMTTNEQCVPLKPAKWRYQGKIMAAANAASVAAAAHYSVPLVDFNGMMGGVRDGGMLNSSSVLCKHSLDGVHVLHWVDGVRARAVSAAERAPPPAAERAPRPDRSAEHTHDTNCNRARAFRTQMHSFARLTLHPPTPWCLFPCYPSAQVRAAILLSYLCDESGEWHAPRTRLSRVAEQCRSMPPPLVVTKPVKAGPSTSGTRTQASKPPGKPSAAAAAAAKQH